MLCESSRWSIWSLEKTIRGQDFTKMVIFSWLLKNHKSSGQCEFNWSSTSIISGQDLDHPVGSYSMAQRLPSFVALTLASYMVKNRQPKFTAFQKLVASQMVISLIKH